MKKDLIISFIFSLTLTLFILFNIGVPSKSIIGLWTFILTYSYGFFMISYLIINAIKGILNPNNTKVSLKEVFKNLIKKDLNLAFIIGFFLWIFFIYDDGLALFWNHSFRPGGGVSNPYPIWTLMSFSFIILFFSIHVFWNYFKKKGRIIIALLFILLVYLVNTYLITPGDYSIFVNTGYTNWFWFHLLGAPMLTIINYWIIFKNEKKSQWILTIFIIINSILIQYFYNLKIL
jgi:hypothetical protein